MHIPISWCGLRVFVSSLIERGLLLDISSRHRGWWSGGPVPGSGVVVGGGGGGCGPLVEAVARARNITVHVGRNPFNRHLSQLPVRYMVWIGWRLAPWLEFAGGKNAVEYHTTNVNKTCSDKNLLPFFDGLRKKNEMMSTQ